MAATLGPELGPIGTSTVGSIPSRLVYFQVVRWAWSIADWRAVCVLERLIVVHSSATG